MEPTVYTKCGRCRQYAAHRIAPLVHPPLGGQVGVVCLLCGAEMVYNFQETPQQERAYQAQAREQAEQAAEQRAREAEEWRIHAAEQQGMTSQPDYPDYAIYHPEHRAATWWRFLRAEYAHERTGERR